MNPASIGPYQIVREIGRGGMGEVFLARDPRLDRQVAIKALPAHLAADPDRLARFQREAKVLASLNHPGIGAIYGLEEVDGHQYLILEFIEGETLADRLSRGTIPVDEALAIGRQIAEALEVAHEKGVIHRDLKPANVMVTPEGAVKVLDFGLARTTERLPSSSNYSAALADSPTLTSPMPVHSPTIPGVIMGTAGYMSPEQARGKALDKRTDIWSLGCVLYECLAGSLVFGGETVSDAIAAILERDPDWRKLPARTPMRVRDLLKHCLEKDPRRRLRDAGDAKLELENAISNREWNTTGMMAAAGGGIRSWKRTARLAVSCVALVGLGAALSLVAFKRPASVGGRQAFHVSATVPSKPAFTNLAGLAPDARYLVYTAWPELAPDSVRPDGVLMVRRLDRDEATVIEGTEGARDAALSPDGRWLAFSCAKDRASSKFSLKKIAMENGRSTGKPETVCELPTVSALVLCWASEREIAYSPSWEPVIYAVPASGGEPRVVLREDLPKGIESWAEFRPLVAGQSILATRWSFVGQKIKVNTEAIDLVSGKRTVVLPDAGAAQYLADEGGGYLLATRSNQTSLVAVRFDPASLRTAGEPVTVWTGNPINTFRIAPCGTLALSTRPAEVLDRRLAWVDDKGQALPIAGMTRSYGEIAVSPDSGRVLGNSESAGTDELISECWVQDLARRTSTRIAVQGAMIGMAWSNDGQQIVYGLAKDGGFSIVQRRSDGSGEAVQLLSGPDTRTLLIPTAWSRDGKTLAIVQVDMSTNNSDAYLLEQASGPGQWVAKPYLKTPASEELSGFSADGKWTLIGSSQSGRRELYIQRYSGDGDADAKAGRVQVSTGGANSAWWSPDGKEIRYLDPDRQVMSVQIKTEPTPSASEPKVLYSVKDLKTRAMTFGPDGRLMVVLQGESEQTTMSVGLVVNFVDELRTKIPSAK